MATLMRREPFGIDIPEWMSRWFEERWMPDRFFAEFMGRESMRIEEFVEADTLVVKAEMPGIDPEKDVEIWVHDGLLHIKGERSTTKEETEKASYRSEFHYGMFERTVPMPAGAKETDVKATYKDGVLEVRVPLQKAVSQAAKIPVERIR